MKKWSKLPPEMQTEEIRPYYEILKKHKCGRFFKRLFDIVVSFLMLIILFPFFLILALAIKIDSRGPVFYRQERVTRYGKHFRIFKFRTMRVGADKQGEITVKSDSRVTRIGRTLRKLRIDETAQLIDVFRGTLSFVGTRPEVPKFVEQYTPEMMATLLMPAGVTSMASIYYKDEAELMDNVENADEVYVKKVLPCKMYYNLKSIRKFGFWRDIGTLFKTVFAVCGKKYVDKDAPAFDEVIINSGYAKEESIADNNCDETESDMEVAACDTVTEDQGTYE